MAVPFSGCGILSLFSISPNLFLFSARSILSGVVPSIFTPALLSFIASFSGVCPPNCTITPYGFSASITFITSSNVRGSKYSLSEVS